MVAMQDASVPMQDTPLSAEPAGPTDAPSADVATERAAPHPLIAMIRSLAAPTSALEGAVSPSRGVSRIQYVEAPPSGNGRPRISAERYCAAAIGRASATLRADLAEFVQRIDSGTEAVCGDDGACVVPGMEYQPSLTVRFAAGGDGATQTLESFERVSLAALSADWTARARAHVERALSNDRARRCAAR
jgi:hypothetical protein